jgi:hypothetical protein
MSITPARGLSADVARALEAQLESPELMRLAVHQNPAVRAAVGSRQDCPVGALISLGNDHSIEVLEALLRNPRTPASVIRKLADHRNQRISDAAVQRLRNQLR